MNRLADQTSPYLRQHAANPVEWYPWGDEALAEARVRDVPILLSVGYSACHWCHVMAHESFEDPDTAAVMNENFVNIKVDREERPDIDAIYMEAVQAVNGSGGWPMTVFLLPDGRPFFAGTYLPRARFVDLMGRIEVAWDDKRAGIERDAERLAGAIRAGSDLPGVNIEAAPYGNGQGTTSPLEGGVEALVARFDPEWGGFGQAPKFPQPCMLELLWQGWARSGLSAPGTHGAFGTHGAPGTDGGRRGETKRDKTLLDVLTTTLDAMASGGIYDHLGGGFARYATDRRWLVPHFEKMLYDNALLTRVYLHAWQATGEPRYRQVVTETVEYLLSPPMRQPGAGFSSAEDADSEGVEGKYYVWSAEEVLDLAGAETAEWYGVTRRGNWEGTNILWRPTRGDLLRPHAVETGRRALLAARSERVRPGLDDKVLTEWNAMAIAALAEAGAVLAEPAWVDAAIEVAEFLVANLRRADGRWLRSWQHDDDAPGVGRAQHLAYASDHAWLVEAFTRLAEATGQARWIAAATEVADQLIGLFWDADGRGFHTAGSDAETLIARPKDTYDGAVPSANSVAALALLRLAALGGNLPYQDHAEQLIEAMGPALDKAPSAFSTLVTAADLSAAGITEVAVTGDRPDLVATVRAAYRPDVVLAWGEPYDSPLWEGRSVTEGLAYVCRHWACGAPVSEPEALAAAL
jgi:uncharacterized protein